MKNQRDVLKNKLDETKALNELIDEAYVIFKKHIKDDTFVFKTEIDKLLFRKQGFEHIITGCCLNNCRDIKIFKDKKDICIWCKNIDFLIILSERQNGYILLTAYGDIYFQNSLRSI